MSYPTHTLYRKTRAALFFCSLLLAACQPVVDTRPAQNKAIVARYLAADVEDLAIIDELFDPAYVEHDASKLVDFAGMKQTMTELAANFPDAKVVPDAIVAEQDKVAVRFTLVISEDFQVTGTQIFRLENGKIVEVWENFDDLGFLTQLGVIPPLE